MGDLLFDRKLLKQNQTRYLSQFDKYNFLHHEVASRLIDSINLYEEKRQNYDNILEISCLDQFFKDSITKEKKIKEFFQTSLVENIGDMVIDDEDLDFKPESFDLILSNLNLHFINKIEEFMLKSHNFLKKDGILGLTFFGEQNLFDLKRAVLEAENEVFSQISPRIIPTIDVKNAARLLQKAGFRDPVSSLEIIEVEYENPINLLKDLKFMMQGNIMLKRSKKFINRKFLDEILNKYAKIAGSNDKKGIKARFEIIILIGKK